MITVYGIANCDMVKKTLLWFKKNKIDVKFYDYKKQGITKEKLTNWCKQVGWEIILNKKSTTWRTLTIAEQEKITNQAEAIELMLTNTSIIKRPVVEYNEKIIVGFEEKIYQQNF
jgi:arsenate reductase